MGWDRPPGNPRDPPAVSDNTAIFEKPVSRELLMLVFQTDEENQNL